MPSPELPDDRRGQPRRPGPPDPGAPVGERPADRVPGTGVDGAPFPGPNGVAAPNGLTGPNARGYGDFWGDGYRSGQPGNGGPVTGLGRPPVNGHGPHNGQPLPNGHAPQNGNGQAPQGPGGPGLDLGPNGSSGWFATTRGPAGPPPGPRPDDDRPTDVHEAVRAPWTAAPAQAAEARTAAQRPRNTPAEQPPSRDDADAEDTSVDPQLRVEPGMDPEGIPGRHRRRAGASPDSRSAADYVKSASAGGKKQRSGRRRRSTFWKELPILIGVALVLTILIQAFLAKVYVIPSGSMETTLHGCTGCTNDRVLVDKITYRFSTPQPGDVVVFRGPDSWLTSENSGVTPPSSGVAAFGQQLLSLIGLAPPDEKDFVKRVIAVGGQTVKCCDTRNRVLVDDKPLNEPYIYWLPEAGPPRQMAFGPVTVPQGELWVMGDSRNNSQDSRINGQGPVPVANVIGKARMIVLPVNRFGLIASTNPQTSGVAALGGAATDGLPLALGVVGVLPFWLVRRRFLGEAEEEFLPRRRRT